MNRSDLNLSNKKSNLAAGSLLNKMTNQKKTRKLINHRQSPRFSPSAPSSNLPSCSQFQPVNSVNNVNTNSVTNTPNYEVNSVINSQMHHHHHHHHHFHHHFHEKNKNELFNEQQNNQTCNTNEHNQGIT